MNKFFELCSHDFLEIAQNAFAMKIVKKNECAKVQTKFRILANLAEFRVIDPK